MRTIKRYIHLYFHYFGLAVKSSLSYRFDTVVGILGFFINNFVSMAVLLITISSVDTIGGWSFANMAFLYGCLLIPKGIDHLFTDQIWQIGNGYVKLGKLDKYLTKPINTLFQIVAEQFQHEGLGELILGIVLICVFWKDQAIIWTFGNIVAWIVCEFFAIFVFTSIKLLTATISFWTKHSIAFMTAIYDISLYVRYPIRALGKIMVIIMFYIVPFGLVIYYPMETLLNGGNMLFATLIVMGVSTLLVFLSYGFWRIGLTKYESAGS